MSQIDEIIGKKFGTKLVLKYAGRNKHSQKLYECQCDCGIINTILRSSLLLSKQINCSHRVRNRLIIGEKFGTKLVLKYAGRNKHSQKLYECQCDCGIISIIIGSDLARGRQLNCKHPIIHGLSGNTLYGIWRKMKDRCFNKNCRSYPHYGGRGITMYQPWINDVLLFINYIESTIGLRPENPPDWKGKRPYYELDRRNNNGNYEPGNLRWVTKRENNLNRRTVAQLQLLLDKRKKRKPKLQYVPGQLCIA